MKNLVALSLVALLCVGVIAQEAAKPTADLPTELDADRVPPTRTGGSCLIRNVNILTATGADLMGGDLLVLGGKIVAIGKALSAGPGALVIEGRGRWLMPGIIDCHSHMAIDRGINEPTNSITAEVRIDEVVRANDVSIYRALAGGVTCARLLHGSANVIGGQDAIIKLKYGRPAEELLLPNAPRGIKFALGENVTRANSRGSATTPLLFPSTRQGVEALLRRAFTEAREYQRQWDDYSARATRGEDPTPLRRDLRLETLAEILRGTVRVHSHGYRADELRALIRVADEFGWKIATFQHGLEAYKIAPEIARHGAGVSTFSDWWAYKFEAFDAIPYNAALCTRAGVVTTVNSDSAELIRRLNLEAAKACKYGGLTDTEALRLCTLNVAIQLGIAERTGSIELGKDADLALFNGHPLSVYAICEMTLVDGEVYFERKSPFVPGEPKPVVAAASRPATAALSGPVTIISGATLHPIVGPDIVNGSLAIQGDRILAVAGSGQRINASAKLRIEAKGLHIWPGMIDCGSETGLSEVQSIAGTVDLSELGSLQPDLIAGTAYNPASDHVPVTRVNGVTTALLRMTGGRIAGQASLVHLAGFTLEEATVKSPCALVINYPNVAESPLGFGKAGRTPTTEVGSPSIRAAAARELERVREFFKQARQYAVSNPANARRDPRLEALLPYVRKQRPVIIRAQRHAQIVGALKLIEQLEVNGIIAGATEGWKCAELIAKAKVPVIVGKVLALPMNEYDPYDATYANAGQLARAGVKLAFQSDDVEHARNLPYNAAMAVAYGLPRDEALRGLTINAAEMLGVEALVGSLELGKVADLVITDGDLLEIRTQVKRLFIGGEDVPLSTRHTRLYETYLKRIQVSKPGAP